MSVDGQFPRFFQHDQPARRARLARWGSTSSCSLARRASRAARSRSTRSRTSATRSRSCPVLVGYYLLRKYQPERCAGRSGCPSSSSTSRSCMAVFYFVIWLYGGIVYTSLPTHRSAANTRIYYFIGWVDPARLPAALLVPHAGRGSEARGAAAAAGCGRRAVHRQATDMVTSARATACRRPRRPTRPCSRHDRATGTRVRGARRSRGR